MVETTKFPCYICNKKINLFVLFLRFCICYGQQEEASCIIDIYSTPDYFYPEVHRNIVQLNSHLTSPFQSIVNLFLEVMILALTCSYFKISQVNRILIFPENTFNQLKTLFFLSNYIGEGNFESPFKMALPTSLGQVMILLVKKVVAICEIM